MTTITRGKTNPARQVARATKFRNIGGISWSLVWTLFHVTHLETYILRWLLHFLKKPVFRALMNLKLPSNE